MFRAALIPSGVVKERAKFVQHTNSYKFMLSDDVWDDGRVKDVTADLRAEGLIEAPRCSADRGCGRAFQHRSVERPPGDWRRLA